MRFVVTILLLTCPPAVMAQAPSDIKRRVDELAGKFVADKKAIGLIVVISDANGKRQAYSYSDIEKRGGEPRLDNIFEIGSISKPMTALLLALMIEAGEMKLDDPVQKFLPEEFVVPRRGDRDITLLELATHTSGLPRLPSNFFLSALGETFQGRDPSRDPYGAYDMKRLAEGLDATRLKDVPRPKVVYSNFGFGLLGEALSHKAGMSYEALVRTRIAEPLRMADTFVTVPPDRRQRMAIGHNSKGVAVDPWTFASLAGGGAVRSTADDMLTFLEAQSGRRQGRLDSAMRMTQSPREEVSPGANIGLGWFLRKHEGRSFWWHNGGTGGFSSFAGFARDPAVAVVVLANVNQDAADKTGGVDAIGGALIRHLMSPPPE